MKMAEIDSSDLNAEKKMKRKKRRPKGSGSEEESTSGSEEDESQEGEDQSKSENGGTKILFPCQWHKAKVKYLNKPISTLFLN